MSWMAVSSTSDPDLARGSMDFLLGFLDGIFEFGSRAARRRHYPDTRIMFSPLFSCSTVFITCGGPVEPCRRRVFWDPIDLGFPMGQSGFGRLSWSSEFVHDLISLRRRFASRIAATGVSWFAGRLPGCCFYKLLGLKSLLCRDRGPKAASSFAHGAPLVDEGGRKFRHPQGFECIYLYV